jgi:hypothetical protein
MIICEDEVPDPGELLRRAYQAYVNLHAKLSSEVERLTALKDPKRRRAAEAAAWLEAFERAEPDEKDAQAAKAAAVVAKQAHEEAKHLLGLIAAHQKAIEEVKDCMRRIEAFKGGGAHGRQAADDLDLESARREILGELARLAAGG